MDLDTVDKVRMAWYRLVGMTTSDKALETRGESADDVAYLHLTRGCRAAQRHLLRMGYGGWRKRSSAITSWSGTDDADGGRYTSLPTDFLRAYGNRRFSALVEADGDRWGEEIGPEDAHQKGDFYYIRDTSGTRQLWLTRNASPPATVYLEYHYQHPTWNSGVTIDFPLEVRALIVAEAAVRAMDEVWFPGGPDMEGKIERAWLRAREEARHFARQNKGPRTFRKVRRVGNRW